jgi:predicted lipase
MSLFFSDINWFKNYNLFTRLEYDELILSSIRAKLCYSSKEEIIQMMGDVKNKPLLQTVLGNISISPISFTSVFEDVNAFLWIESDVLYLSYRGTSSVQDALGDMNALPIQIKDNIYIHEGFYEQFKSIEYLVTKEILKYPNIKTIQICGHSLGGAVAQIAAAFYGEKFHLKTVICHTIGCPRTGNDGFVEWFSKNVKKNTRIVNKRDIVTMVPQSPIWLHTMDKCIVIDNNCNVDLYLKEKPWYLRFFSSISYIDLILPIKDHDPDIYILRLLKLREKVTKMT